MSWWRRKQRELKSERDSFQQSTQEEKKHISSEPNSSPVSRDTCLAANKVF